MGISLEQKWRGFLKIRAMERGTKPTLLAREPHRYTRHEALVTALLNRVSTEHCISTQKKNPPLLPSTLYHK